MRTVSKYDKQLRTNSEACKQRGGEGGTKYYES